jgi:RimJ/RimL family protein N-acetyltransferase
MKDRIVLEGTHVRLEPLAGKHLNALLECANDPALWEFTFQSNPFTSRSDAECWLDEALSPADARAFAIVDRESGELAGSTRYLDISEEHRKLEIGWTFLARRFWRTHVNTEAKLLLLQYAFENWRAVRVQLKAEAINLRSHRAILRLGATHEGTLRNFRIRPGTAEPRDVAFYSVTSAEWPSVKARLLSRLTSGPLPASPA